MSAMDGMSPRLAEIAAKNDPMVQLRELDEVVLTRGARLQGELRRKLERSQEDT